MIEGWSRIEIAGKPADVFEPNGPPRFALLWLRGQDQSPPHADASLTSLLGQHRLLGIAPVGQRCWWVDRVCPEFDPILTAEQHLLKNIVPWLGDRFKLSPRSIGVAGMEMGGQGAIRLGLKHPSLFRSVASLGGAIDFHELHGRGTPLDDMYDSKERARQDTATLHMHPNEWPPHIYFACDPKNPWFRGNDRLDEKLRAYGVPHTADLETGGNLETMLQFVVNGLEKESRRLM
jgi:hypothetical protein